MAKKIVGINTIEKRLKKTLENQGSYNEGLDILIEMTAGNLYAYHLARRDVETLDESFVVETTREGNEKLAPHPAIKIMREQTEMVRRNLRELRLTLATAEGMGDDEFAEFIDEVNKIK